MKKWTLLLLALLLAFGSLKAQNNGKKKMKIAVMDFKAGVGVNANEVEGLSDMLINTLYETKRFNIVERTQLYEVLKEQKLQGELTVQQCVQVGRVLGVESVLIGTVNFLPEHKYADGSYSGEYNVDVRAVDVESGEIVTTAGATKSSNSTYRAMMEKIGKQLAVNLMEDEVEIVEVEEPKPEKPKKDSFRKSGFTIRPELGFVYGKNGQKGDSYEREESMIGAVADVAIGFQVGSYFFFGAIVGYGGNYHYLQTDYDYCVDEYELSLIPLLADARWYMMNHKNTFIVDIQGGFNLNERHVSIIRAGVGFTFSNFEATAGIQRFNGINGININASYRIGNVIKKWW